MAAILPVGFAKVFERRGLHAVLFELNRSGKCLARLGVGGLAGLCGLRALGRRGDGMEQHGCRAKGSADTQ